MFKKIQYVYLLKKYIKWGVWRVAVCPSYIQYARFLKVNVVVENSVILRRALKKLCLFNLYYFVNGASRMQSLRAGSVFCFLPKYPHWLCTSPSPLFREYQELFPHWPSSQGMEMAVHVLPMVRLGMCVCSFTFTPPICLHGVHRDNFTFTHVTM